MMPECAERNAGTTARDYSTVTPERVRVPQKRARPHPSPRLLAIPGTTCGGLQRRYKPNPKDGRAVYLGHQGMGCDSW